MSIQTEIERIAAAKLSIKDAIEQLGAQVPEDAKIDEYADLIRSVGLERVVGELRRIAFQWDNQNYVLCDGRLLSKAEYPELYSKIGNTYGSENILFVTSPVPYGMLANEASSTGFPKSRKIVYCNNTFFCDTVDAIEPLWKSTDGISWQPVLTVQAQSQREGSGYDQILEVENNSILKTFVLEDKTCVAVSTDGGNTFRTNMTGITTPYYTRNASLFNGWWYYATIVDSAILIGRVNATTGAYATVQNSIAQTSGYGLRSATVCIGDTLYLWATADKILVRNLSSNATSFIAAPVVVQESDFYLCELFKYNDTLYAYYNGSVYAYSSAWQLISSNAGAAAIFQCIDTPAGIAAMRSDESIAIYDDSFKLLNIAYAPTPNNNWGVYADSAIPYTSDYIYTADAYATSAPTIYDGWNTSSHASGIYDIGNGTYIVTGGLARSNAAPVFATTDFRTDYFKIPDIADMYTYIKAK